MFARREHARNLEALPHVLDLADRAQVDEQRIGLIGIVEEQERLEQLFDLGRTDTISRHGRQTPPDSRRINHKISRSG